MLTYISGVGFDLSPGDVTDRFTTEEAGAMLARGYAVPDDSVSVERAVHEPVAEKRRRGRPAKVAT